MKRTVLAGILWLSLFAGQIVKADQFQGFTLKGHIKGLKNGTILYLIKDWKKDTIASVKTLNGAFTFKGIVKGGTDFFYLRMDTTIEQRRSSEFLLINKTHELTGDFNNWPKVELKGSSAHEDFLAITNLWTNNKDPERMDKIKAYVNAHTGSLYLPYLILNMDFKVEERSEFYERFTPEAKSSFFGKRLFEAVDLDRKRKQITEGSIIPDFKVSTQTGEQVSIRTFVAKNKYTLIDFWASWCKPCRAEVPNLKKVYTAFKNKGFGIVGVALSDKEPDWKRAIAEDQTSWTHGRDADNTSYRIFDIPAIPGFALVDQQGKLIAFNCEGSQINPFGPAIRGEALYQSIGNLLGTLEEVKDEIKPLKLGDQVPDIELGEIINHPTLKSAKISDFKGKLLILDFWSTWCSICIAQLPHMYAMQQKFGDKVAVLPVGFDANKLGDIKAFVEKRKGTNKEIQLPTVIQKPNDSVLMKYFPFSSLPCEIWIDGNGKLIGITDHLAVTEKNISGILNGKKLLFNHKKIKHRSLPKGSSFLLTKADVKAGITKSAFFGNVDSLTSFNYFYPKLDSIQYRAYWANQPVFSLYRDIYNNLIPAGSYKRTIVESKGKPFYKDWTDTNNLDNWGYTEFEQNHLFSYEIVMPKSYTEKELREYIIRDFDGHFKIKSRIEKRKVKCLAVVKTPVNTKIKANIKAVKEDFLDKDLEYRHLVNYPITGVINQLNMADAKHPEIIDETNSAQITALFPKNVKMSISEVKALLNKYGFDIKEVIRERDMLVLENIR